MALLGVSNLTKAFGTDLLFEGVSFEVQANDKIGVVGVNGSGKTTLFKMITGEMRPDDGELYQSKQAVVGYMEQHVCKNLEETALDEVLTVFTPLMKMEEEIELLNVRLQKGMGSTEELIERQALLNDRFVREGGMTYRSRARSALLGLGFSDEDMTLTVGALSGGQKAKLQLAKMLLSGANLLLLDEPTNHLDIVSKEILEQALKHYTGTVLYVSHDRYFINQTATRILELTNQAMVNYIGNYDYYLEKKEELTQIYAPKEEEAVADVSASATKLDWKQQKEEQARLRKRENDLKKTEAEIEKLETRDGEIDEEMAQPEVAVNVAECVRLSKEKAAIAEKLEELYAKWEELA